MGSGEASETTFYLNPVYTREDMAEVFGLPSLSKFMLNLECFVDFLVDFQVDFQVVFLSNEN